MTNEQLISLLENNNAALKDRRIRVRGEIVTLQDEIKALEAKEAHNKEIIALLRPTNDAKNETSPEPDIEE